MKTARAVVLATPPVAGGFALGGIPAESTDAEHAPARIRELVSQRDLGVLLVEDDVLAKLDPIEREALDKRVTPVVVPFAGPTWAEGATGADAYVLELLRRAIGYRVRLR